MGVYVLESCKAELPGMNGDGEPLLLLHGMTGCHEDWQHAGRQDFLRAYQLIAPDARGHGRSTNPAAAITHRQCALDTFALLDHLGIQRCRAIGVSMGGNILPHMATLQPERIAAMVLVSAIMRFPEQARAIMRPFPVEDQPPSEWETMRRRHKHGDAQIIAMWQQCRALKDSCDDMNFTPANFGFYPYRLRRPRPALSRGNGRGDVPRHSQVSVVGSPRRRTWPHLS